MRQCVVVVLLTGLELLGARPPAYGQGPVFNYIAQETTIEYDASTGNGSGVVSIYIQELPTPGFPNNVSGWSLSLASDANLLDPTFVTYGSYLATVKGGAPPDFFQTMLLAEGITVGTVYCFIGCATCTYEVPKEVLRISYDIVSAAVAGDADGETTTLVFEILPSSSPPIPNVIVVSGQSVPIIPVNGTVTLLPSAEFIRGDSDGTGQVLAIVDAILLLNALFVPGASPLACRDAADIDDDGSLNLADPVMLLNWGFLSGPTPGAPFPACGADLTVDTLDCATPFCP